MNRTPFSAADTRCVDASIQRLMDEALFDRHAITLDDIVTELGCYALKLNVHAQNSSQLCTLQKSALLSRYDQHAALIVKLRRHGLPPTSSAATTVVTKSQPITTAVRRRA